MKKRCIMVAIFSFALVSLGQGFWSISEAQEKAVKRGGNKGTKVRVIEEEGPAGHQTIGIDEDSVVVDSSKELQLTFRTLMTWEYDADSNSLPPENIRKLNDRKVRLVGFMYPLQEGGSIRYFCLLRTTQTCCYGPRPQYNQYVFVEMAKPTKFYRLDPVCCVGTFKVEPTPEEGFIFRMEGKTCESITR